MSLYRQHTLPNYKMGHHYTRHISAMTGEALHSKAEIAEELAWRDMQIESLQAENAKLRAALAEIGANGCAEDSIGARMALEQSK